MNQHSQPDPLDQILLSEDALLPSSGFVASVMDRIEVEVTAPAPIPFPWKRAFPGIAALFASLYFLYRLASAAFSAVSQSPVSAVEWLQWLQSTSTPAVILRTQAAPVVLAVVGAWLCVLLCTRLAGSSSVR